MPCGVCSDYDTEINLDLETVTAYPFGPFTIVPLDVFYLEGCDVFKINEVLVFLLELLLRVYKVNVFFF